MVNPSIATETVERMHKYGFVLWPEKSGRGLYLVKRMDVTSPGIDDEPNGYGNLLFGFGGILADPHHPEEDGYGEGKEFQRIDDALTYLLDDYERVAGPGMSPVLSYPGGPATLLHYLMDSSDVPALDDATYEVMSSTELCITDTVHRVIRVTVEDLGFKAED